MDASYLEMLDLVDERVLDDVLQNTYGHDAVEQIEVDAELSRVAFNYLIAGLIDDVNDALNIGDFVVAVVYRRILKTMLEIDEETREAFEAAQRQPDPEDMMEEMGIDGFMAAFDLD